MTGIRLRVPKSTEILLWVYGVGLAGMLLPFSRGLFTAITPLNLLFALFWLFWGKWPARQVIITGSVIAVTSFLIEAAGVNTWKIFGVYAYGNTLGPKLLNTPVIIGLNWFLLIYCTNVISRQLWDRITGRQDGSRSGLKRSVFIVGTGSLLMVFYDMLLEPAATRLDMWSWECGIIPLRNFLAWFLLSLVFHIYLRYRGEEEINPGAFPLFAVQLGFFAASDLFYLLAA
jgi:putative membrane protein